MPWLSQTPTAGGIAFLTDLSFCQMLQILHSGNPVNVNLNGGWAYLLYLPLPMAMANTYALVFRKMQGLSLCTSCAVFA
ncbi:MAG: hypothetical protein LUD46_04450 [Parabacteroides sp.]|nr:hypothetical protein [Parabacteroides sp.]